MEKNLFNLTLAEIEIDFKTIVKPSERRVIKSSKDAEEIFRIIWGSNIEMREESYILLLNRANRVLGFHRLSQGSAGSSYADVRRAFAIAMKCLAPSVIVAHNHQFGNLKPTADEKSLTRKYIKTGKVIDIAVLDHLILTSDSYYSFADEGLL